MLAFTNTEKSNLSWFWGQYLKARAPRLFLIFILAASQGVVYQQFLQLTDRGLRVIFTNGDLRDLFWVCFMVFLVFMYRGVMTFVIPRLAALVTTGVVMKMRNELTARMMHLDLAFFDRSTAGGLILRIVQQTRTLSDFIGISTVRAIRDFFTIIIVSGYLIWKQPLLFLIAVVVIPFVLIAMQIVSRISKGRQKQVQSDTQNIMDAIEEVFSGIRTVKISGQVEQEKTRLSEKIAALKSSQLRFLTAQAASQPFVDFAAAIVYMLVIGLGGYFALSPDYDVDGAEIITFLLGLVLVFDPGRRLANFWVSLQSNLVILDAIRDLHGQEQTIVSAENAVKDFDPLGDIQLNNIDFSYDTETPLIENLSLTFKGGKTTAIVGTTGSGKTTILSLIARLYDVTNGGITIGGTKIKDIHLDSLRSAFSVVAQDIVIFNASVEDNIRYVRPDANPEDVIQAAKSAEIYELMQKRGDTPLGAKGSQLSGGQRQRIAIARAFLSDAPILFLDEATSALDQKTEDKVKFALRNLSKDRTTIVVAHRLSTITNSDNIIVLEGGNVVEQGTHKKLMTSKGLYETLFTAQNGGSKQ